MRERPNIPACFATLMLLPTLLAACGVLFVGSDPILILTGLFLVVGLATAAGMTIWGAVLYGRAHGELYGPLDVVKYGVTDLVQGAIWKMFGEEMKKPRFYKRMALMLLIAACGGVVGYLWSHR